MTPRIRPIAICLLRQDDRILVFEGYDFVKQEVFYRPLGGAIEFGETGEQAIRREIEEELGAKIVEVRYLYTLENIFVCNGEPGHEIVLVYAAQFAERSLYDRASFAGQEDNGVPFVAIWKPLGDFGSGGAPLYPDGLLENLQ
jgi:8-oxo-dGTP pyrophosphatase MutT (NUDIX family)